MTPNPAGPGDSRPTLLSIQVGKPRRFEGTGPRDRPWRSGFVKEAVNGPVRVGRLGLDGDGQADRKHHGGPDQALLAYGADHYPSWRAELDLPDFPYGALAENLTIAGLDETTVCVGDTLAIGAVQVQVSQPRIPCWKIARRWGMPDLVRRVEATGRTGWYLRVLVKGEIAPGMPVLLLDRPYPEWTVTRAHAIMRERRRDSEAVAALAGCQLLSPGWRARLAGVRG